METMEVNEFSEMLREENQDVVGDLFEMLRALTRIDDAIQISSKLVKPDGIEWGWGFWW